MTKFVGHYGEYLLVRSEPGHGEFSIAWYFPKEGEFGAFLGEDYVSWEEEPEIPWDRTLHRVNCAVEKTLGPQDSWKLDGFRFAKWSSADNALRAANLVLRSEAESLYEP